MMPAADQNGVPDLDSVRQMIDSLEKLIAGHRVRAAWVCEAGGIAEGLFKMSLGNRIGVTLCDGFSDDFWFERHPAAVIISCDELPAGVIKIAETVDSFTLTHAGRTYDLAGYFEDYANRLAPVYPYRLPTPKTGGAGLYRRERRFVALARRQNGEAPGAAAGLCGNQLRIRHRPRF